MKAKKIFAVMLCGAMLASFTACENGNEPNNGSGNGNGNQTEEPDFNPNGHEYVDLGLPSGLLWATCNVGAISPEESGDYFAWGETETKPIYGFDNYKWISSKPEGIFVEKYFVQNSESELLGNADNKQTLESSDDAARAIWGESWRMPTKKEMQELLSNCIAESTTLKGVKGLKLTSKTNENSIFLPMAGNRFEEERNGVGEMGIYWTSTLCTDDAQNAAGFYFDGVDSELTCCTRCYGFSVRAVSSPQ